MYRGAGTGLMGGGIVLVVMGAILEFAVSVTTTGFNINTVGLILLAVGIGAFLAGIMVVALGGRRRSSVHEDIHTTPAGRERIEEREDWAS